MKRWALVLYEDYYADDGGQWGWTFYKHPQDHRPCHWGEISNDDGIIPMAEFKSRAAARRHAVRWLTEMGVAMSDVAVYTDRGEGDEPVTTESVNAYIAELLNGA